MGEKMNESDILVVLYPNRYEIKSIIIIDPFDGKIEQYKVDSLPEAKEVLKENLPFCSQNHSPILHMGVAYIAEWGSLRENNIILYPNKNEVKSIIIVDPNNNKVEMYKVNSIDETRLENLVEWESLPETKIFITKPQDIDEVLK